MFLNKKQIPFTFFQRTKKYQNKEEVKLADLKKQTEHTYADILAKNPKIKERMETRKKNLEGPYKPVVESHSWRDARDMARKIREERKKREIENNMT